MTTSIRIATLEDAEAVARLMTGLNETVGPENVRDPTPEDILVTTEQARARLAAMAATEQVLLAEVDGAAAGMLSLRIMPYLAEDVPHGEIAELFVEPEHRRKKTGMLLMAEAERIARERGCTGVKVRAFLENERAHAFYRAMGYDQLEVGFEKALPRKSSARNRRAEG